METTSRPDQVETVVDPAGRLDRLLAWGAAAVLILLGIVGAFGGAALAIAVDRSVVTDAFRGGDFRSSMLTEAEAIDASVALADWGGIGLVLAGGVTGIVGISVVIAHRRARGREHSRSRWIPCVLGACVGGGLWFLPLSPILGGALAGYLDARKAARGIGAGTLAGVLASLPVVVASLAVGTGFVLEIPTEPAVALVGISGVGLGFVLAYLVGLGALGGFIGGRIKHS